MYLKDHEPPPLRKPLPWSVSKVNCKIIIDFTLFTFSVLKRLVEKIKSFHGPGATLAVSLLRSWTRKTTRQSLIIHHQNYERDNHYHQNHHHQNHPPPPHHHHPHGHDENPGISELWLRGSDFDRLAHWPSCCWWWWCLSSQVFVIIIMIWRWWWQGCWSWCWCQWHIIAFMVWM